MLNIPHQEFKVDSCASCNATYRFVVMNSVLQAYLKQSKVSNPTSIRQRQSKIEAKICRDGAINRILSTDPLGFKFCKLQKINGRTQALTQFSHLPTDVNLVVSWLQQGKLSIVYTDAKLTLSLLLAHKGLECIVFEKTKSFERTSWLQHARRQTLPLNVVAFNSLISFTATDCVNGCEISAQLSEYRLQAFVKNAPVANISDLVYNPMDICDAGHTEYGETCDADSEFICTGTAQADETITTSFSRPAQQNSVQQYQDKEGAPSTAQVVAQCPISTVEHSGGTDQIKSSSTTTRVNKSKSSNGNTPIDSDVSSLLHGSMSLQDAQKMVRNISTTFRSGPEVPTGRKLKTGRQQQTTKETLAAKKTCGSAKTSPSATLGISQNTVAEVVQELSVAKLQKQRTPSPIVEGCHKVQPPRFSETVDPLPSEVWTMITKKMRLAIKDRKKRFNLAKADQVPTADKKTVELWDPASAQRQGQLIVHPEQEGHTDIDGTASRRKPCVWKTREIQKPRDYSGFYSEKNPNDIVVIRATCSAPASLAGDRSSEDYIDDYYDQCERERPHATESQSSLIQSTSTNAVEPNDAMTSKKRRQKTAKNRRNKCSQTQATEDAVAAPHANSQDTPNGQHSVVHQEVCDIKESGSAVIQCQSQEPPSSTATGTEPKETETQNPLQPNTTAVDVNCPVDILRTQNLQPTQNRKKSGRKRGKKPLVAIGVVHERDKSEDVEEMSVPRTPAEPEQPRINKGSSDDHLKFKNAIGSIGRQQTTEMVAVSTTIISHVTAAPHRLSSGSNAGNVSVLSNSNLMVGHGEVTNCTSTATEVTPTSMQEYGVPDVVETPESATQRKPDKTPANVGSPAASSTIQVCPTANSKTAEEPKRRPEYESTQLQQQTEDSPHDIAKVRQQAPVITSNTTHEIPSDPTLAILNDNVENKNLAQETRFEAYAKAEVTTFSPAPETRFDDRTHREQEPCQPQACVKHSTINSVRAHQLGSPGDITTEAGDATAHRSPHLRDPPGAELQTVHPVSEVYSEPTPVVEAHIDEDSELTQHIAQGKEPDGENMECMARQPELPNVHRGDVKPTKDQSLLETATKCKVTTSKPLDLQEDITDSKIDLARQPRDSEDTISRIQQQPTTGLEGEHRSKLTTVNKASTATTDLKPNAHKVLEIWPTNRMRKFNTNHLQMPTQNVIAKQNSRVDPYQLYIRRHIIAAQPQPPRMELIFGCDHEKGAVHWDGCGAEPPGDDSVVSALRGTDVSYDPQLSSNAENGNQRSTPEGSCEYSEKSVAPVLNHDTAGNSPRIIPSMHNSESITSMNTIKADCSVQDTTRPLKGPKGCLQSLPPSERKGKSLECATAVMPTNEVVQSNDTPIKIHQVSRTADEPTVSINGRPTCHKIADRWECEVNEMTEPSTECVQPCDDKELREASAHVPLNIDQDYRFESVPHIDDTTTKRLLEDLDFISFNRNHDEATEPTEEAVILPISFASNGEALTVERTGQQRTTQKLLVAVPRYPIDDSSPSPHDKSTRSSNQQVDVQTSAIEHKHAITVRLDTPLIPTEAQPKKNLSFDKVNVQREHWSIKYTKSAAGKKLLGLSAKLKSIIANSTASDKPV